MPSPYRRPRWPGALPGVTVVRVVRIDEDGRAHAVPARWPDDAGPPPAIHFEPDPRARMAPAAGDRVLARLEPLADAGYRAMAMRRLDARPPPSLGIFRSIGSGGRVEPVGRRAGPDLAVAPGDTAGAADGEIVAIETQPRDRLKRPRARILQRLGPLDSPGAFSLIAMREHEIPDRFPAEALALAAGAQPVPADARTDLRHLPLVTIDGADARDFDDAVWAEPLGGAGAPDGWRLIVAIADVAHYVRPGDDLDREASRRGNSVYFPDRAVPMLPPALSEGLCSLMPGQDRGCLAVEIVISAAGDRRRHRFFRALIRSAARLTYEQAQAAGDADDGAAGAALPGIGDGVRTSLAALFGAYAALARARERRGALDLDLPEREVRLGPDGRVRDIALRDRLDSHRLIEEFMVLANVCAATTLQGRGRPCLFRVHDRPDPAALESLRRTARVLGLPPPAGAQTGPDGFNRLLRRADAAGHRHAVNDMVLRAQSRACYQPGNIGHFGLGLACYTHFTSPIRRYADLSVHRALIDALGLGPDGEAAGAAALTGLGRHLSMTERRAEAAERATIDRMAARFMAGRIGESFEAAIVAVTRHGAFARLDGCPVDGLISFASMPADRYDFDDEALTLTGREHGLALRVGDRVTVALAEVSVAAGRVNLAWRAGGTRTAPGRKRPSGPGRYLRRPGRRR